MHSVFTLYQVDMYFQMHSLFSEVCPNSSWSTRHPSAVVNEKAQVCSVDSNCSYFVIALESSLICYSLCNFYQLAVKKKYDVFLNKFFVLFDNCKPFIILH